jgi:hypothetical protein
MTKAQRLINKLALALLHAQERLEELAVLADLQEAAILHPKKVKPSKRRRT